VEHIRGQDRAVVAVSARFEWEIQQLAEEEQAEFREAAGMSEGGLQRLVQSSYSLLQLIPFYTVAHNKLSAWAVVNGTTAPEAAGKIHSDMQRGFVRAQVVPFAELLEHGSLQALNRLGHLRTEGKDYVVQPADVIEFLFKA
jgi:ribosome-binding ATPase YchF (GTP1/OBG family)